MNKFEISIENLYYYDCEIDEFLEVLPSDVISGEWRDNRRSAKKSDGSVNRVARVKVTNDFQEKHGLELDAISVYEQVEIGDNDVYDNSEALYYLITPD